MKRIILSVLLIIGISTSFVFASGEALSVSGSHKIDGVHSGTRTIVLEDVKSGAKERVVIDVNSSFTCPVTAPLELGTYVYKLYQEPISAEGLSQDRSVYTIEVNVNNDKNVLVLKNSAGQKIEKIEFTDTYKPVPSSEPKTQPTTEPKTEPKTEPTSTHKTITSSDSDSKSEPDSPVERMFYKTGESAVLFIAMIAFIFTIIGLILAIRRKNSYDRYE